MDSRAILHVDMNNFYASVECLHNPSLRGKPVAVGGNAEARHGIILAKNYEAKAYNIKTGEALWQARQKCPGLIIVPPHYEQYLRFSRMARDIYDDYTDQVEPFGLDECWLDVTGSRRVIGEAEHIAEDIRARVKEELGVTVSIGVSYNKVFAKLGSDMKKPDAITLLTPDNYREKAWPLPAEELLYVGPATKRKLYSRGVTTIGRLANTDPKLLQGWFGKWGLVLHAFANGQDSSPVKRARQESVIKSVGNSTTCPRDIANEDEARLVFWTLADSVAARLREYAIKGRTVQISLRDNQLYSFERQLTLSLPTNLSGELLDGALRLLQKHYHWQRPLRSIGLRACNLVPESTPVQLSFFDGDAEERIRQEKLERTIDDLRERFGHQAVLRGVLYTASDLGMLNPREEHVIHPASYFGGE